MARSFRKVRVGDVLKVRFNGSAMLGNSPYVLDDLRVTEVSDDRVVTDQVEFYFHDNRWRYGASAEVATILDVA